MISGRYALHRLQISDKESLLNAGIKERLKVGMFLQPTIERRLYSIHA
jgi:hypothetical protein